MVSEAIAHQWSLCASPGLDQVVMGTLVTVLAISHPHGSQGKVEIQLQGETQWGEVGKGCHKEMWMQKQGEGGDGQLSKGSPMHQHALGRGEALGWPLTPQSEHFELLMALMS